MTIKRLIRDTKKIIKDIEIDIAVLDGKLEIYRMYEQLLGEIIEEIENKEEGNEK